MVAWHRKTTALQGLNEYHFNTSKQFYILHYLNLSKSVDWRYTFIIIVVTSNLYVSVVRFTVGLMKRLPLKFLKDTTHHPIQFSEEVHDPKMLSNIHGGSMRAAHPQGETATS